MTTTSKAMAEERGCWKEIQTKRKQRAERWRKKRERKATLPDPQLADST